jgi:hypothetical protein
VLDPRLYVSQSGFGYDVFPALARRKMGCLVRPSRLASSFVMADVC